jgi:hypothetical protein
VLVSDYLSLLLGRHRLVGDDFDLDERRFGTVICSPKKKSRTANRDGRDFVFLKDCLAQ